MKSIIASAKYKGKHLLFDSPIKISPLMADETPTAGPPPFTLSHGQSHMISIQNLPNGCIAVFLLEGKRDLTASPYHPIHYKSVISFLVDWEEITSYATLKVGQN